MRHTLHLAASAAVVCTSLSAQLATASRDHASPASPDGGVVEVDMIGFEGKAAGEIVDEVFSAGGLGPILVEGRTPSLGDVNSAIVFDSSNPTGGDPDLGTPNEDFGGPGQGSAGGLGSPFANDVALENLLILAEDLVDVAPADGLVDDPDDADQVGASLTFDFSAIGLVAIRTITVIDFEPGEDAPIANFFGPGGTLIASENLGNPGDNGVAVSNFTAAGVERLVIEINGSGGVDAIGFVRDCNGNGVADPVDIDTGTSADCNGNGVPDECDIADGTSDDCDGNGVPDECQPDCDGDGIPDACDDAEDCFDLLCAVRAVPDDCAEGILATSTLGIGGNFTFVDRGEFKEFPLTNSATLKGVVQSNIVPSAQFDVCIDFVGLVQPGDADHPPVNSPKLELDPNCYEANGGDVDTDDWRYYTTWTGVATGLGSLDGAVLTLVGVGPAFQVGEGANGKNQAFGASGWLEVTTVGQPTSGLVLPEMFEGDINVDLVDCPPEQ